MTKDFSRPLLGYGGKPVTEDTGEGKAKKAVTLGDIMGRQLYYAGNGKDGFDEADKVKAYRLSVQMSEHPGRVEMTVEDAGLIKKLAQRTLVAGVCGQIVNLIEEE